MSGDRATATYITVHPDLLKDSCLLHGPYDGERCSICAALALKRNGRA